MTEFLEENTTDTKKEDSLESRFARLDEIVSAMDGDESYIISHHQAAMEKYTSLLNKLQKILK